MDKKIITGSIIFSVILITFALFGPDRSQSKDVLVENNNQNKVADKIEVVHFHATQQCWSCTTVGEYVLKTIKERFPQEYKEGKIVFKSINGELPDNQEIVMKYQAGGTSLFINAIIGDKDNIEEDTMVWRLVSNEQQFLDYFETKLKKLLGK